MSEFLLFKQKILFYTYYTLELQFPTPPNSFLNANIYSFLLFPVLENNFKTNYNLKRHD